MSLPDGTLNEFVLYVPGKPRAMPRARVNPHGHRFHDAKQEQYASTVQGEWIAAGRPRLRPGPYTLMVRVSLPRPKGHFNAKGELNKKGLENPYPTSRPDVDNYLKQVDLLVALNAVPDDALMVAGSAYKGWEDERMPLGMFFRFTSLVPSDFDDLPVLEEVAE